MSCPSSDPKLSADQLLKRIKDSGSRLTWQRKFIVESLFKFQSPFTAEELHRKVQRQGIDLTTVYRSLNVFCEKGYLSQVDFNDGVARFEVKHDNHHHHHIVCQKCKAVEALPSCDLSHLETLLTKRGYADITHRLEFFGLCKRCV